MFYPMAGTRLRFGSATYPWKTTDYLEGDFALETWIQVGEVESFGNVQIASKVVEFDALWPPFKRRAKGARDYGVIDVTYALDSNDAGQKFLQTMEQSSADYVFNMIFNDAPVSAVLGTVTVTIASPGVFTLANHGLVVGSQVKLSTTGALPTGLTAGTTYWVTASNLASNTFTLSATKTGLPINTSGTQSGVHTVTSVPQPSNRYFIAKVMSVEDVPGDGPEAVLKGKVTLAVNCKPIKVDATP